MNKLQELIDQLCPGGVEYKALGDVAELVKGSGLQKKDFVESGVGCIHYGQIHMRFGTFTSEVLSYVPEELAAKLTVIHPGDVVVAVTSEDVSACCKAVAWVGDTDIVTGGHCVVIRHGLDPKYLSYCFQTKEFFNQKKKFAAGVKVVEMRTDKLARIRIPVPPIEVQREVVRILDEYTEAHDKLVCQLKYEMVLRKKQLSIARNQLLTFTESERVRWATLGELGSFYGGLTGKTKNDFGNGMPFVTYMQVYMNAAMPSDGFERVAVDEGEHQNAIARGDVLITISSENREDAGMTCVVTHVPDEPTYLNSFCTGWRPYDDATYNPDFLKHLLRSDAIRAQIRRSANGVTRFNISKPKLAKTKLPIPPLDYQLAVTKQLDDLTSAIEQVSVSIEAEIELLATCLSTTRNQLLSFPEKAA